jgi:hypothetical protein
MSYESWHEIEIYFVGIFSAEYLWKYIYKSSVLTRSVFKGEILSKYFEKVVFPLPGEP